MCAAVALTMFSGPASVKISANGYSGSGSSYSEDDEVKIPKNYRDDVLESLGRKSGAITKTDLESISRLELLIENDTDSLSFVNYCTSMNELYLANLSDDIDPIRQIGKLDKLDTLTFDNGANTVDLNVKNCGFLYNNENIKTLNIYGNVMAEPELVCSMPNLEHAAIEVRETTPFDLKKIPSLKVAYIYGDPYDISINVTVDDINYLLENGVDVFLNTDSFEEMKKIDAELNDIISTLDVNENSTDREKMDAIIVYELKNFVYDDTVDSMSVSDPRRIDRIHSFYKGGYLYGALEKNTKICGNYAAFFTAVATRIGLESYMMMSDFHCWNLVNADGNYYYTDITWMDCNLHYVGSRSFKAEELFEKGDREHIDWYMDQPKSYTDYDHQSYNYPGYLEDELSESVQKGVYGGYIADNSAPGAPYVMITDDTSTAFETNDFTYRYIPKMSDEQYELMVYGTLIIVPAGFIAVIITAVCVAKAVKKKKQEKEENRYYSEHE